MGKHKTKHQRSLEQVLQEVADTLFPAQEGTADITVKSADSQGDTALHVCLWRGDDYAAQLLIANGANVHALGEMDETPLHVAAIHASSDTMALLLAAGAKETAVSKLGETPRQSARRQNREGVYQQAQRIARDLVGGRSKQPRSFS